MIAYQFGYKEPYTKNGLLFKVIEAFSLASAAHLFATEHPEATVYSVIRCGQKL